MTTTDDRPTIEERVARAERSSHLQHLDRPCDVDVVGAVGLAGIENGLAQAVYRLKYGNDASCYPAALVAVQTESRLLGRKGGWEGSAAQFDRLCRSVLEYWLVDRCMQCTGRGYETILGTPHLSAVPCGACGGTCKARTPDMGGKEWQDRFDALLARIERLERMIGGQVMGKLAREVSDL